MFIRYWLPITPINPSPELASRAEVGFAYFLAFHELKHEMRVLPSVWTSQQPYQMFVGQWAPYSHYATTMVPLVYANIVLGDLKSYTAKHTAQAFIKNIAICSHLTPGHIPSDLNLYQKVWVAREEDQRLLLESGIKCEFVKPSAEAVGKYLE